MYLVVAISVAVDAIKIPTYEDSYLGKNCSVGTCFINASGYRVTLDNGTFRYFYSNWIENENTMTAAYSGQHGNDTPWTANPGGSGGGFFAIYSDAPVDAWSWDIDLPYGSCTFSNETDYLLMACSKTQVNGAATARMQLNYSFYPTYIKADVNFESSSATGYRVYFYEFMNAVWASLPMNASIAYNGTTNKKAGRWSDWESQYGWAGYGWNTSYPYDGAGVFNTTGLLAILWNATSTTDFDMGAGYTTGTGGIAVGRGTVIGNNTKTTFYIKILPRDPNELGADFSGHSVESNTVLTGFSDDKTFGDPAPYVHLIYPPNNESATTDSRTVTFVYNVTSYSRNIVNCSLLINGVLNQTDSSITPDSNQSFELTFEADQFFTWNVQCNDSYNATNTSLVTFNHLVQLDTTAPAINFVGNTQEDGDKVHDKNWTIINVSTSDTQNHSVTVDFNRSLLLWLHFDNGTAYDQSSYAHTLNITSNVSFIHTTNRGTVVRFPEPFSGLVSQNDMIKIPSNILNVTGPFTIEAWVKTYYSSSDANGAVVAGQYDYNGGDMYGWMIGREYSNGTYFHFYVVNETGSYTSVSIANFFPNYVGKWMHVAGVYDGTNINIYLNGTLAQSTAMRGVPRGYLSSEFTIGHRSDSNAHGGWPGDLDEIKFYNRALNLDEIKSSYNGSIYYKNFTGLAEQNYSFLSYAIDAAGNINQTENRTINISWSYSACNCPTLGSDWIINLTTDHCNITNDCNLSTGFFKTIGGTAASDYISVNATIWASGFKPLHLSGSQVYIRNNGVINVK